MKVTLVGSHLCQHTIYAITKLRDAGVDIDFRNISTSFADLKDFMREWGNSPLYEDARQENRVGIPLYILEDGTKTRNLNDVLNGVEDGNAPC